MIRGIVTSHLEAIIRLFVREPNGPTMEIEAVIDTGFSGSLTLPSSLIRSLGLTWICRQPGILADGKTQLFDVYSATVNWNGKPRPVEVEAADIDPLLGMALLEGHDLQMHVAVGGRVVIEAFS
jgi:clan AA aspartic protease